MKAAAIYARVSTTGQAKDGTSLDTQTDACKQYAQQYGYTVIKEVREDISGGTLKRPGLDGIRDVAERREIQAVIIYDPDRLSRDLGHMMLLVSEFERAKVQLYFVNTPHENTPEGMMLLQMRGMFAQYERTKIQERSRRGKERRAKDGHVIVSWMAPYGYVCVPGEGRFELHPAESEWVAKIFDWLANEHATLRGIGKRLDQLGVSTKRGARFWDPATVRSIVTNPTYTGTWFWNKTQASVPLYHMRDSQPKKEKSAQHLRPREEWIGVAVPAIITPEVFEAAQCQLERNKRMSPRNCKHEYLLRGIMVCRQCDRLLIGRCVQQCRYHQYYCTGKYAKELKAGCKCPFPNIEQLERRVWAKLVELLGDEDKIMATLKEREHTRESERRREDAQLGALISREQAIKIEETRLTEAYGKGVIDLEQLQEYLGATCNQRQALQQAKNELQEQIQKHEVLKASEMTLKRQCALVRQGLHLFNYREKRECLQALELKGVADGVTDKLVLTGIIKDLSIVLRDRAETR